MQMKALILIPKQGSLEVEIMRSFGIGKLSGKKVSADHFENLERGGGDKCEKFHAQVRLVFRIFQPHPGVPAL